MIYLIGSLRNFDVPKVATKLREAGYEVFDDWYAAGPEADDYWKEYEQSRGHSYSQALAGYAARNTYNFDRTHLMRCSAAVLVLPAGRSGHLELGYVVGQGKPGYILLEGEPDRWDVMYSFADGVYNTTEELIGGLNGHLSSIQLQQSAENEDREEGTGRLGAQRYFHMAR